MAKVNFLSNRELLSEIHKSKNSFCSYIDRQYANYDGIFVDLNEITLEVIAEAREKKAQLLVQQKKLELKAQGLKAHQIKVDTIEASEISINDLVFRIMDDSHIPTEMVEPAKSSKSDKEVEAKIKLNFKAFKHFVIKYLGDPNTQNIDMSLVTYEEVGRSHWVGGLQNGHFSLDHGNITDRLAQMYLKLVDRYAQRHNWRGYSYLDEMKSQALLQLIQVGLKFDERRSQNPFAYYTTTMTNSFTGVFHKEKRNQTIRDDILIIQGQSPSNTRMVEHEMAQANK